MVKGNFDCEHCHSKINLRQMEKHLFDNDITIDNILIELQRDQRGGFFYEPDYHEKYLKYKIKYLELKINALKN